MICNVFEYGFLEIHSLNGGLNDEIHTRHAACFSDGLYTIEALSRGSAVKCMSAYTFFIQMRNGFHAFADLLEADVLQGDKLPFCTEPLRNACTHNAGTNNGTALDAVRGAVCHNARQGTLLCGVLHEMYSHQILADIRSGKLQHGALFASERCIHIAPDGLHKDLKCGHGRGIMSARPGHQLCLGFTCHDTSDQGIVPKNHGFGWPFSSLHKHERGLEQVLARANIINEAEARELVAQLVPLIRAFLDRSQAMPAAAKSH